MQTTIGLSYIIGHRGISRERIDNLYAVVNFLHKNIPGLEIIVVEQDSQPSQLSLPSNVKYVFLFNPGLYNRAWGFNVAVAYAQHNVVAFGDNDLIVPPAALIQAYNQCLIKGTASPYNSKGVIDLTLQTTKQFNQNCTIPARLDGQYRPSCNYAGGILLMTKTVFKTVGGWEEKMEGWGGEDSHMFTKLQKLNIGMYEVTQYPAIHLYHERNGGKPQLNNPHYKQNSILYKRVKTMTPKEIKEEAKKQIEVIGNPNLYKEQHERTVALDKQKISKTDAFINLYDFKKAAMAAGITFFLDGGTLLGAIRDKDFCEDDQDDIDLTAFYLDWNKVELLEQEAKKLGFSVYHKWDANDYLAKHKKITSSQISFKRNGGKIDLMFKKKKDSWLWWTVFHRSGKDVYKKIPYQYMLPLKNILFYGEEFFVPNNFNDYLTYRYDDWQKKVHRSNYSCYKTDLAIVKGFEDI